MTSPFTHILLSFGVTHPQLWQVHDEVFDGCIHSSEVVAPNNSRGKTNENIYTTDKTFGFIAK